MKTPISYYGGKQNMLRHIMPIISELRKQFPNINGYSEPFLGGGAVFWSIDPFKVEIINDTNRELINFYEVVKNEFIDLEKLIRITLHSRSLFNDAKVVYDNPHMFSRIKRAWALWVLSSQGFAAKLDGSWGYDKKKATVTTKIDNKKASFTEDLAIRLQHVQIECTDALRIINSRDSENILFYCDPPYFNSDCGHYDGYTLNDFESLLKVLSNIKGKFLLSSYRSDVLTNFVNENGWNQLDFEAKVSVSRKKTYLKKKVEILTANFPLIS